MARRLVHSKLLQGVLPFAGVVAFSTVGYMLIGGWSLFDSLYFTVITVFGIGFGEHDPMTDGARFFTVVVIAVGFGALAYAGSVLVQAAVESQLGELLGQRRMEHELRRLNRHYIVCGAGRMGRRIVREMQRRGVEFVVIDGEEAKLTELREAGMRVLCGDATNEDLLRKAGVERAAGIVCAVASDADNLFITLNARDLNKQLLIVARANDEHAVNRLRKAGADRVVSPIITGSHQMAQMVLSPAVADLVDLTSMRQGLELALEQVEVRAGSPFIGTTLEAANFTHRTQVMIVALKTAGGPLLFNPAPATVVGPGDTLLIIGSAADCERLERIVNPGRGGAAA